ncbi:Monocarboxylate transporter 5, partial [Stegodyphus mimosarum]
MRNGVKIINEASSLKENIHQKPRSYMISDGYIKSNAEKKLSTISLNPALLEKNEIFSITNAPMKAHSATNLVANLEKKLEGEKGCDNLAFALQKQNNPGNSLSEKRLSIQNVFATSKESLYDRIPSSYDLREESLKKESSKTKEEAEVDEEKAKSLLESVKTIARLYKNPIFVLICVCMATYVLIFIPLMTSAIDYSKDKGLPENVGKYLIHAMAFGDILGRLCFGWVTDKDFISIPHYMIVTLILEGIFIILLPLTTSLFSYLLLLALYAMTAGSMLVRMPVLVLKHVKKEEHSVAMGCYGFVSGLVPLGVPSLIGYFRDNGGSYDHMYYLMGSLSIISGGFWLLEPSLARLNDRLQQRREDTVKV